jgi:hypothetical protein
VKDRVATVLKHDAMKTYGGDEVKIYVFLTPTLGKGKCSHVLVILFRRPLERRLDGRGIEEKKISAPAGNRIIPSSNS